MIKVDYIEMISLIAVGQGSVNFWIAGSDSSRSYIGPYMEDNRCLSGGKGDENCDMN